MPKKISDEEILNRFADKFKELRSKAVTEQDCAKLLGTGPRTIAKLRKLLGMNRLMKKWQKVGMPRNFSERTKSLIYGTLMGDASIHIPGFNHTYKSFTVAHSPKQLSYLEYKRELLSEIKPYEIKETKDSWGTLRFITAPHPEFDSIYKDFYCGDNNQKEITNKVLELLTPESIALWFMDDGSSDSTGFRIATCAFSIDSLNNIVDYFHYKYNIIINITRGKYLRLSVHGFNAIKFRNLIEPFIIPDMLYKIYLTKNTGKGSGYREPKQFLTNL